MLDPRAEALIIRDKNGGASDETLNAFPLETRGDKVSVTFVKSGRSYDYPRSRVTVLRGPTPVDLREDERLEVRGEIWSNVMGAWRFADGAHEWTHIAYQGQGGERFATCTSNEARIVRTAGAPDRAREVLGYWRSLIDALPEGDPLTELAVKAFENLDFIRPDSVLAAYLQGGDRAFEARPWHRALLLPFGSNLSQREAVRRALESRISVIDGPPGTGKTQTILNLVANLVESGATVGIVSSNNAAVANVGEKLTREGLSFVTAALGRKSNRDAFLADQEGRNGLLAEFMREPAPAQPSLDRLVELDTKIAELREHERRLAQLKRLREEFSLERRHLELSLEGEALPDIDRLPLASKSSDRILDYLARSAVLAAHPTRARKIIARIVGYFLYGSMHSVDPEHTSTVLSLQRAFFMRRLDELTAEIDAVERLLMEQDFDAMVDEHRRLSGEAFRLGLRARYAPRKANPLYDARYRQRFGDFTTDYPVILSTCHSLRGSIGDGKLLDYLIVDEASQVDLLVAAPALACARNLVVVGDLMQLPHIVPRALSEVELRSPYPAYDYHQHNLLSSLIALFGDVLPRTMLREHYRCHPDIIGFCNEKFYGGKLIPFTKVTGVQPLVLTRLPEGEHMRGHRGGGITNQRELEVIVGEILPDHCAEFAPAEIGIATPYRKQADRLSEAVLDEVAADTVHSFQGREKKAVVLSTVVDESALGRRGLRFVDDPNLVNVAVSRAVERLVLVTHHKQLPKSRNLRELVGYMRHHLPGQNVVESDIVSVFDLLYREYSARLRPLASRLGSTQKYKSEEIVWTLLQEILGEEKYSSLAVVAQVLLRNLLPDRSLLDARASSYVDHRASVDFAVYNRVTRELVLAIEVDGFAYHENNPVQLERDRVKNEIFDAYGLPLLRLPTTGSGEEELIRARLSERLSDR